MHILVSLPLDEPVPEDLLLANIRSGLGGAGKDCDAFAFPEMKSESMDALFDAEERLKSLDGLVQDAIRKYLPVYLAAHPKGAAETAILGKTFDHYLKSFKWDGGKYPLEIKLGELLGVMEQEVSFIVDAFTEKNRQYSEELKRQKPEPKKAASIRTLDINAIAYRAENQLHNSFLKKYYIGVKEKLREKDLQALGGVDGLFIESRVLVSKCFDGEIYAVLGRIDTEEQLVRELEAKGYCVRQEAASAEAYQRACAEAEAGSARLAKAEQALRQVVSGNIQKLYVVFFHVSYLGLYVESILRFGPPAVFCFFILGGKSRHWLLEKWKKIAKTWKYSKRVVPVNPLLVRGSEHVYDFVYRELAEFDEGIDKAKSEP